MIIFKSEKGLKILSALKRQNRNVLLEQRKKERALFDKIVFESTSASAVGDSDLDTLTCLIKNVEGHCGGAFPGEEALHDAVYEILRKEHIQHPRVL